MLELAPADGSGGSLVPIAGPRFKPLNLHDNRNAATIIYLPNSTTVERVPFSGQIQGNGGRTNGPMPDAMFAWWTWPETRESG
jgi:hypothetical protein